MQSRFGLAAADLGGVAISPSNSELMSAVRAALLEQKSRSVLEIAADGYELAAYLGAIGFDAIAITERSDWSESLADRAKAGMAEGEATVVRGNRWALPLRRGSVDSVVSARLLGGSLSDTLERAERAMREVRRVARRGIAMRSVVVENLHARWLGHYFPRLDTVLPLFYPTLGAVIVTILRAGFTRVTVRPLFEDEGEDCALIQAVRHPQLLFDPLFRRGLGVLRGLSVEALRGGLELLARDLESGRFSRILAKFEGAAPRLGLAVMLSAVCR